MAKIEMKASFILARMGIVMPVLFVVEKFVLCIIL